MSKSESSESIISIEDIFKSPSAEIITEKKESILLENAPFTCKWSYGVRENIPLINLNTPNRTLVFYAASHNGVLYDFVRNEMKFLYNHQNVITNIASDSNGKWIVTADSGPNNCVSIWDSESLNLAATISNPHLSYSFKLLSFSLDGKYVLTFAYEDEPKIHVWNWSKTVNAPVASALLLCIKTRDVFEIIFDPKSSEEFCVASSSYIYFGYVDESNLTVLLKKIEIRTRILYYGFFQCVTYCTGNDQLLACTDKGYIAIFKHAHGVVVENDQFIPKTFLKMVKIERRGITVVKACDGYVVICNEDGEIHIYDNEIKILFRFDNFDFGTILALSFNSCYKENEDIVQNYKSAKEKLVRKVTLRKRKNIPQSFITRDAYIFIEDEGIGLIDFSNQKYYKIFDDSIGEVTAMAIHPDKTFIAIGDILGNIKLINYNDNTMLLRGCIPYRDEVMSINRNITCLKFSDSGTFLTCGIENGDIWHLDPMLLEPFSNEPIHESNYSIKQIEYSQDSIYMAYNDIQFQIVLFKYDCYLAKWTFIGKNKTNCSSIVNMYFEHREVLTLLTFSFDRMMNVYNIEQSPNGHIALQLVKTTEMEKYAKPNYVIKSIWPNEKNLLIISSDDYKYKVYDCMDNKILATYLGPVYASTLQKIIAVPPEDTTDVNYILFCTDQNIGVQKLPLNGNPFMYIAILGHPKKINNFFITPDGKTLFTSGEDDTNVIQWEVHLKSVEPKIFEGGEGIDPYITLIEGGRKGWIFEKMKVLFYYAQILCQGDRTPFIRNISETIPVSTLPDIMRAIGYFPTDWEIQNLMTEVNFNIFNKKINIDVSFDDYVKLYINYRPAFGEVFCKYQDAFNILAERQKDGNFRMIKSVLTSTLAKYGENVTEKYAKNLITILASQLLQTGKTGKFTEEEIDSIVPKKMSIEYFFGELMGFNLNDIK